MDGWTVLAFCGSCGCCRANARTFEVSTRLESGMGFGLGLDLASMVWGWDRLMDIWMDGDGKWTWGRVCWRGIVAGLECPGFTGRPNLFISKLDVEPWWLEMHSVRESAYSCRGTRTDDVMRFEFRNSACPWLCWIAIYVCTILWTQIDEVRGCLVKYCIVDRGINSRV
ncbi:hypothetical protein M413DRAFT_257342 [Hebeloma cylindrosporum]|uniref:Uncharacterized protein n=1 Tax=Hebeloma cylindrosporum TaxID=76867 RepID=A0A0C2Y934_HEBCY|nr:hypothetical protein M413DRAFT_257342 [Hebeloma cylindrosporum h7]